MKQKGLITFTERLYELRGNRSQEEFAKFLGISRPSLGSYENGNRVPNAQILKKISEKCGVSTDYLLGLSDYKQKETEAITAQDMGLTENCAKILQGIKGDDNVYAKIICAMVENEYFPSFALDLDNYLYIVRKSEENIADDNMFEVEVKGNTVREARFYATDSFSSLLSQMAPEPDFKRLENEAWERWKEEHGKHKENSR